VKAGNGRNCHCEGESPKQYPTLVRLLQKAFTVIPAKAGIQSFCDFLDPGFRRGDGVTEFCKRLLRIGHRFVVELLAVTWSSSGCMADKDR
jgi:hypothetical protein